MQSVTIGLRLYHPQGYNTAGVVCGDVRFAAGRLKGGTMDWSAVKGVISDMDGVLWRGETPLPGLVEFFAFLEERGIPLVLATNNSSKAPEDYLEKLARMGITRHPPSQIVTSGTATLSYLRAHYPAATTVHVLGGDGLKRLTSAAGFELVDDDRPAQVVVAGIDFNLTYDRLRRAARHILRGADFIGTNADAAIPFPDGLAPGAGSILSALITATGREPLVIGKPGKPMFEAGLEILGTQPSETIMLGDRLDTDVMGANHAGLFSILMLTGVVTADQVAASSSKPSKIYADLPALISDWRAEG